ncbi:MAG TPA: TonB-dependent receptor, partial [Chryseosolibacter sp.]|nr:TonB-dependent receptor [Chryseosolibacter sp.]
FVAGYKTGKNTETTITYFNASVKNNIQLRAASSTGFARQYANIGRIESSGIEASLRYKYSDRLAGFVNFTFQHVADVTHDTISAILESSGERVRYEQTDFHPGGMPECIGNAGIQYSLTKNISAGLSGNYAGERIRTDQKSFEIIPGSSKTTGNIVGLDNRENIPARVLINASLRFHDLAFAPGLDIQLSGYNLTDSENYNEAGAIRAADLRREGVNWMAKVSYRF